MSYFFLNYSSFFRLEKGIWLDDVSTDKIGVTEIKSLGTTVLKL